MQLTSAGEPELLLFRAMELTEIATKGAGAGASATLPMSLFMIGAKRALTPEKRYALPPHEITESFLDSAGADRAVNSATHTALTIAAHFGYGALMGAVYASFSGSPKIRNGMLFGAAVWVGSYFKLLPALGILKPASQHPAPRNLLMFTAHLVWGAALARALGAPRQRLL